MDLKKMTFIGACNAHFGRRAGQSLKEFSDELKTLTPKDQNDMIKYFVGVGIDATMPPPGGLGAS